MIPRDAKILKQEKRRQLRALNKRASPSERARASELIDRLFRAMSGWESCQSILFFAPQPNEPDIWRLIGHAVATKKTVALPKFDPTGKEYRAAAVRSLGNDLEKGRFGVPEPKDRCDHLPLADIDMILVPGSGFDLSGNRLGRGKGFYDRILERTTGLIIGVAFDWQITEGIPSEAHDISMHRIVTPSRWLVCNEVGNEKRRPRAAVENITETR